MGKHVFTAEDRRKGGAHRAQRADWKAAQAAGGKTRAGQPAFLTHQKTIARKGYEAALARVSKRYLLERICAWRRQQPGSQLERFVAAELERLGYQEGGEEGAVYTREMVVDLPDPPYCASLDFVVNAPDGIVVLMPGAQVWHGDASQSLDGQDHTARDRVIDAQLQAAFGWTVLRLSDDVIIHRPAEARRRIAAAVAGTPVRVAA